MLLDIMKADSLAARKARETERATTLVTLYAEAARVGKDVDNRDSTDAEVVQVVRKFIKGLDDSLAVLTQPDAIARAQRERAIVEGYLPAQIKGEALTAVLRELLKTVPNPTIRSLGAVMTALKATHGGAYDGVEATKLVKELLI